MLPIEILNPFFRKLDFAVMIDLLHILFHERATGRKIPRGVRRQLVSLIFDMSVPSAHLSIIKFFHLRIIEFKAIYNQLCYISSRYRWKLKKDESMG